MAAIALFAGCIDQESEEVGSETSELAFDRQGVIHMGWNAWGYSINSTVGGACRAGTVRDHAEIYADYGAPAVFLGWATSLPTDCTARFLTSVSNGHWDDFHWSVFSNKINLAQGQTTSQSSTILNGVSGRAVDGNLDGNWTNGSVTHTDFNAQAWWQVDLGAPKALGEVVVFNRTDSVSERLSNFEILLSNDGVEWGLVASFPGVAPPRIGFPVGGTARFVRVALRGQNWLSLTEVQVFAP